MHRLQQLDLIIAAATTLVFAAIVQGAIPPRAQALGAVLMGLVLLRGMVLTASGTGSFGDHGGLSPGINSHASLRLFIAAFIAVVTTLAAGGFLAGPIIWTLAECQTDQFIPFRAVGWQLLLPIVLVVGI
jgi:hypothetical protein